VYTVLFARSLAGVNLACFVPLSYATVPEIAAPPLGVKVKVEPVSVLACIAVLNVAATVALRATCVAFAAGDVDETVGVGGAGGGVAVVPPEPDPPEQALNQATPNNAANKCTLTLKRIQNFPSLAPMRNRAASLRSHTASPQPKLK
jgi:hypothetical protein